MNEELEKWQACPACDLLITQSPVTHYQSSYCPRCNTLLQSPQKHSIENTLALSCAGIILFFPAVMFPIMTLKVLGESQQATMLSAPYVLYQHDMQVVSILVFLFSIVIPLLKLILIFITALSLAIPLSIKKLSLLFRWYHLLDEWGMIEVYMLGILVAYIKLVDIAEVVIGPGLYLFSGLLFVVTLLSTLMDEHQFWIEIENNSG